MFVFNRSALAVLLPLALLAGAVLWSSDSAAPAQPAFSQAQTEGDLSQKRDHAVAANLPSR